MRRLHFLFLLFLLLLPFLASAQTITVQDVIIDNDYFSWTYDSKLDVDIKFGNANQWVADSYKDYERIVQYEDKTNHRLILKCTKIDTGLYGNYALSSDKISFTTTIDCRADKYRITIKDLMIGSEFKGESYDKHYGEYVIKIPQRVSGINQELSDMSDAYEKAKANWDKARAKWRPGQHHYDTAEEEYNKYNSKILFLTTSKEHLLITEETVKTIIAEYVNSLSSAISFEDDF